MRGESRARKVGLSLGIVFCVLLANASTLCGQGLDNPWFVRAGISPAHVLPSTPFGLNAQGETVDWVPDLTVEIGRQTNGNEDWHHLYGLPSYGFGVSLAQFENGAKNGRPLEAYTFFSWPFARLTDRMAVTTDFGMGLSWDWQEVLGSDLNARIDWGFYLRYLATPRTTVFTGIDFTHRSNGGVVQPDKGINVLGPKVMVQYGFGRERPKTPARSASAAPSPQFQPQWELLVGGAAGLKNVIEQRSPMLRHDFGVFHATAALQRQFYRFGKIAGGTDVTYDGGTGAVGGSVNGLTTEWRAAPVERWAIGMYGGYEHIIGRFSVFVHAGYNVARGFDGEASVPRLYQRFGWRYRFSDRFWGTVAIRSIDGHKADFLEVGAGYRIRLSS